MRRIYSAVMLMTLLFLSACEQKKPAEPAVQIIPVEEIPAIVEAHGTIGDGTSMNVLEFINSDGDTLYINMNSQAIMGGVGVGDEVEMIYNTTDEGLVASVAINTTALQHLWTQKGADGQPQSLELDSDGRATTYDMSINYDSWAIVDGLLLLRSPKKVGDESPAIVDTFHIMELTDRTLVLMSDNITTEFECEN